MVSLKKSNIGPCDKFVDDYHDRVCCGSVFFFCPCVHIFSPLLLDRRVVVENSTEFPCLVSPHKANSKVPPRTPPQCTSHAESHIQCWSLRTKPMRQPATTTTPYLQPNWTAGAHIINANAICPVQAKPPPPPSTLGRERSKRTTSAD